MCDMRANYATDSKHANTNRLHIRQYIVCPDYWRTLY